MLSVLGMGGLVLGILVWQEGGESVAALLAIGVIAHGRAGLLADAAQARRRSRRCSTRICSRSKLFRFGISQQMLQQIALGGAMIALPIYLQMVLEYNAHAGRAVARPALAQHVRRGVAGREEGRTSAAPPASSGWDSRCSPSGIAVLIPIVPRAEFGWALIVPLVIAGSGLGLLVSQLNNYTLSPISEERVSEAAGVNSAAGSFGLSFGLAFAGAIMLATLSFTFTNMAEASTVLPPASSSRSRQALEDERGADDQHPARSSCWSTNPRTIQAEIIRINTDARPIALQVALLIPLLAGLIGLFNSFRMMRLPDPTPSGSEGMALG